MMNNVQGDCKCGSLGFAAGADLTLATGKLAKLDANEHIVLPTAAADITPYVITCGADTGYLCGVTPLTSLSNSRVVLKGACQAGQLLVAVGDGRVEVGTVGGAAALVGVAEEVGVEGQHVLLRPVTVGARGATGATGATGGTGPGLTETATDRLFEPPYYAAVGLHPMAPDHPNRVSCLCMKNKPQHGNKESKCQL